MPGTGAEGQYQLAFVSMHCSYRASHFEADLQTIDLAAPFPEELHRRPIASAAFLDCASTPATASHPKREGIPAARTLISGDTVIDALLVIAAENPEAFEAGVARVVGTSKARFRCADATASR